MALSERLSYLITANGTDAIRTFEKVGQAADKNLGKADARLDKFAAGATKVGAGMLAFAGVGASALVSLGNGAADLAESQSKVGVVFGESAADIEKWAGDSAQAFGQSKKQALEAAGTYGNLFQAFGLGQKQSAEMSKSLVQLAGDLASFNNTSVEDALQALQSGISGETEPLKRYGVALNDVRLKAKAMELGIYSGTGTLSVAAKAQAAYALILDDTALAQGDFARTSDGLVNQQRIFNAELQNLKDDIGTGLLPMMKGIVSATGDAVGGFNNLSTGTKNTVGTFLGMATAGAGVIGALSLIGGQLVRVRDRFTQVDDAGNRSLTTFGKFSGAATGIVTLAVGVHALAQALDEAGQGEEDLEHVTDALVDMAYGNDAFDALEESARRSQSSIKGFLDEMARWPAGSSEFQRNASGLEGAVKDVDKALAGLVAAGKLDEARAALKAFADAAGVDIESLLPYLDDYDAAVTAAGTAAKLAGKDAEWSAGGFAAQAEALIGATGAAGAYKAALDGTLGAHLDLEDASGDLADAEQRVRDALDGTGDAAASATAKVRTYQDVLDDVLGSALDVDLAHEAATDAVEGLAEALGQAGVGSESSADFMDRFNGRGEAAEEAGKSVVEATADAVKAAMDEVDAMAESGEIADTAAARKEALRQKLIALKEQFPQVAGQIDRYLGRLDSVSSSLPTVEEQTRNLSSAKRDLADDTRDLIRAAGDEVEALAEAGEIADTAKAKHFKLLEILNDLKVRFPELATIIDTYVADVNRAWREYIDAVNPPGDRAPGTRFREEDTGIRATAPVVNNTFNYEVNGAGLDSEAVAELTYQKTSRALVGARVG